MSGDLTAQPGLMAKWLRQRESCARQNQYKYGWRASVLDSRQET